MVPLLQNLRVGYFYSKLEANSINFESWGHSNNLKPRLSKFTKYSRKHFPLQQVYHLSTLWWAYSCGGSVWSFQIVPKVERLEKSVMWRGLTIYLIKSWRNICRSTHQGYIEGHLGNGKQLFPEALQFRPMSLAEQFERIFDENQVSSHGFACKHNLRTFYFEKLHCWRTRNSIQKLGIIVGPMSLHMRK